MADLYQSGLAALQERTKFIDKGSLLWIPKLSTIAGPCILLVETVLLLSRLTT